MPRRRFTGGSRPLGRGARLRKTWCRVNFPAVGLTTTQAVLASCGVSELSAIDATVLRTRGDLLIAAIPDASTDSDVVGLGMAIVTDNARAAGGTSLPGPINDESSDVWFWHRYVPLDAVSLTAGDPTAITLNVRVEIDSKAMRKLVADQDAVLMAELVSGAFQNVAILGGIAVLLGT